MKLSKLAPLLIIISLGILVLFLRRCENEKEPATATARNAAERTTASKRGLNRYPDKINYSKHARCRMQCRDITEQEVIKVLQNGKINYRKSELQREDCKKRYAVEDVTNHQNIRIIVAQCNNTLTVVTCMDLEKEWACSCD